MAKQKESKKDLPPVDKAVDLILFQFFISHLLRESGDDLEEKRPGLSYKKELAAKDLLVEFSKQTQGLDGVNSRMKIASYLTQQLAEKGLSARQVEVLSYFNQNREYTYAVHAPGVADKLDPEEKYIYERLKNRWHEIDPR